MRDQEIVGLYEAYTSIYQTNESDEFEGWVNALVEEGYDLSDYTWDEMYEMYMNLDEANRGEREKSDYEKRIRRNKRDGYTLVPNSDKPYVQQRMDHERNRGKKKVKGRVTPSMRGPNDNVANYNAVHSEATQMTPADIERIAQQAAGKKKKQKKLSGGMRESHDVYDLILSHLIDEGYAETPEAAKVIMVNMSEDWRESILQEITIPGGYSSSKIGVEREQQRGKPTPTRPAPTPNRIPPRPPKGTPITTFAP